MIEIPTSVIGTLCAMASGRLALFEQLEDYHGDLPRGVFDRGCSRRALRRDRTDQCAALLAVCDARTDRLGVFADLDHGYRVGDEVVVPVRVSSGASV